MIGVGRPLLLAGTLALGACAVAPPTGPSVMALPAQGKSFEAFQQDDGVCRQFASQQIGYGSPAAAATTSAVNSAAAGTVLGAAAGAAIGAAAGNPALGAAIGGGSGL
ncbi:MAG TPA: glycine zipper family protein, partial [Stellaceae bacterium]|nr:glycine zipper family protein [Stellaceae bacterium]